MDAFFERLHHYAYISDLARSALENTRHTVRQTEPRTVIVREGEPMNRVHFIQKGWAIRKRVLEDGRRQILNFILPGDCFDLQALIDSEADHTIETITPCEIRSLATTDFVASAGSDMTLMSALWWSTVQEEAVLREQIVRVGRRTAIERVSHLLLELQRRLVIAGVAQPDSQPGLPLTRRQIADGLGLSTVHVSRTITSMRRMELISTDNMLHIIDPESLSCVAGFDDGYLHIEANPLPPTYFSKAGAA